MRTRQITYGKHDSIKCFYYSGNDSAAVPVPEGVTEYTRLKLKVRQRLRDAIQEVKDATEGKQLTHAKARREAYLNVLEDIDETPSFQWFEVGATNDCT